MSRPRACALIRQVLMPLLANSQSAPFMKIEDLRTFLDPAFEQELLKQKFKTFEHFIETYPNIFLLEGDAQIRPRVPPTVIFDIHDALYDCARMGFTGRSTPPTIAEVYGFLERRTIDFFEHNKITSFRNFLDQYMFPCVVFVINGTRCHWIQDGNDLTHVYKGLRYGLKHYLSGRLKLQCGNTTNTPGTSLCDIVDISACWDTNPKEWSPMQEKRVLELGERLWHYLPSDGSPRDVIDVALEAGLNLLYPNMTQLGAKFRAYHHPKIGCTKSSNKRFFVWRRLEK